MLEWGGGGAQKDEARALKLYKVSGSSVESRKRCLNLFGARSSSPRGRSTFEQLLTCEILLRGSHGGRGRRASLLIQKDRLVAALQVRKRPLLLQLKKRQNQKVMWDVKRRERTTKENIGGSSHSFRFPLLWRNCGLDPSGQDDWAACGDSS